ncbi:MAG TPA: hypothetical protein VHE78_06620 [Gemmatimonadaceae bacterium]|nr:hypothetical protein [Gemmatimonadaceae bacterium]
MIPLSPALLVAAANALVGLDEEDESGRMARIFLREMNAPLVTPEEGALPDGGESGRFSTPSRVTWDTAFVHHVGWWAHYDAEGDASSWPFRPSASCDELRAFAAKYDALCTDPLPGDLFLLWSPAREASFRTGILVRAGDVHTDPEGRKYRECATIEGDSDEMMRGSGGWIVRHTRQLSADRGDWFVRWTALDLRAIRARETRRPGGSVWLKAA